MKEFLTHLVATRPGTVIILLIAAFLEAYGDSCFQSGLHRTSGVARCAAFAGGAIALVLYGLMVNTPPWDFGRLIGLYVMLFFLVAQVLAKVRFNQGPTTSILLGGSLIVAGGAVITLWKQ